MCFKRQVWKAWISNSKERNSKTSVSPHLPLLSISLAFAIYAQLFAMTNVYNGSTFHILSLLRDLELGKREKGKRKKKTPHFTQNKHTRKQMKKHLLNIMGLSFKKSKLEVLFPNKFPPRCYRK